MKFIYLFIYLFICLFVKSQNLLNNGSFESYSNINCSIYDMTNNVNNWLTIQSPDYYNAVCGASVAGVPSNLFGVSYPINGNAYAGIIAYQKPYETKEYIYQYLNTSLVTGKSYYVSFYVSLADRVTHAIKNMGVYFSVSQPTSSIGYIPATPQVENQNGYLTDTIGWTKIEGYFIAQGGEQYITIGNFNSNADTDTLYTGTTNPIPFDPDEAYYYIDSVSLYDSLTLPTGLNELKNEPKFNLYPNPGNGKMYLDYELKNNQKAVMRIFDVTGKVVGMYNLQQSTGKLEINEQNLNNGVYYYSILSNGNVTKTDKIIIIK